MSNKPPPARAYKKGYKQHQKEEVVDAEHGSFVAVPEKEDLGSPKSIILVGLRTYAFGSHRGYSIQKYAVPIEIAEKYLIKSMEPNLQSRAMDEACQTLAKNDFWSGRYEGNNR